LQQLSLNGKGSTSFANPGDFEKKFSSLEKSINQGKNSVNTQIEAAIFIADTYTRLNAIHPFREGNGRTAKAFVAKLAESIGYDLSLKGVQRGQWENASQYGRDGRNEALENIFASALVPRSLNKESERIVGAVFIKSKAGKTKVTQRSELIHKLSSLKGEVAISYVTDSGRQCNQKLLVESGTAFKLNGKVKGQILNVQKLPKIATWEKIRETITPESKQVLINLRKQASKKMERGPPSLKEGLEM